MRPREVIYRWFPLALIACGVLCYLNSLSNVFVFDDHTSILVADEMQHLIPRVLTARWLVDFSFRINYLTGGYQVVDYHVTNIMIHIAAALALYGIIRRTLLLPVCGSSPRRAALFALVCSLFWVVHPVQTESVTYICQRYESMMGLFMFLTLYAFLRGVTAEADRRRWWYGAALAACALGIGTKEVSVTVPLLVLLYDIVFCTRDSLSGLRSRWKFHLAMFLTWGMFAFLWVGSVNVIITHGWKTMPEFTTWEYFVTQFEVLVHYLRISVFPRGLCLDYDWQPATDLWRIILSGSFIALLGLASLWALCRRRPLGFVGAAFFIVLAPTSSILPIYDIAVDHRMYVPLATVIIVVVALATWSLNRLKVPASTRNLLAVVTVAAITASLMLLTINRNRVFVSEESLWRDVLKKRPENRRVHVALGTTLIGAGKLEEAEGLFREALKRLAKEGRPEDPFQVTQYVRTHSNLGYLKYRQGRYQEAEENLREALRMSPGYLVARNNLGLVLRALGRTEEALTEWRNALAQSANPASCRCLAGVLAAEGREAEAIVYLERGLEIQPDAWDMMIDLAWLLAGSEDTGLRDPARALALATKVQAALPQESVKVWDVLGMVRAAQKDFKEAAVCAERALRLGRKRKMAGLVKIEERLLDYQRHLKDAGQTAPAPNESNSREEREE